MPKFSEYSKSLRGQILDTLHKTEERSRNYEESCRIRGVYSGVPLKSYISYIRGCIDNDQMTPNGIRSLIALGMDEFADELWGDSN